MRHRKGLSRPLNLQLPGVAEFAGDYYCTNPSGQYDMSYDSLPTPSGYSRRGSAYIIVVRVESERPHINICILTYDRSSLATLRTIE